VDQPAAHELRQIEHHRLDLVILGCKLDCPGQVARFILTGLRTAAEQALQWIARGGFFHHHAVDPQQQGSVGQGARAWPPGEDPVKQNEEHQHEDQDHAVLDR
jgi:hypothetical protein